MRIDRNLSVTNYNMERRSTFSFFAPPSFPELLERINLKPFVPLIHKTSAGENKPINTVCLLIVVD